MTIFPQHAGETVNLTLLGLHYAMCMDIGIPESIKLYKVTATGLS